MDLQTALTVAAGVAFGVAVLLLPGALVYWAARPYLSADVRIEPLDPERHKPFLDATNDVRLWAERHGWHWVGAYLHPADSVSETELEAWRAPGLDRYLVAYRHKLKPNAIFIEFMTIFDDANHLDTLTSRDDLIIPDIPGRFMQCFPDDADVDRLWIHHELGEQWCARTHALRPRPATDDFESLWVDGAQRVIKELYRKPLWFIRVWWWYSRTLTLPRRPVASQRRLRPALALAK